MPVNRTQLAPYNGPTVAPPNNTMLEPQQNSLLQCHSMRIAGSTSQRHVQAWRSENYQWLKIKREQLDTTAASQEQLDQQATAINALTNGLQMFDRTATVNEIDMLDMRELLDMRADLKRHSMVGDGRQGSYVKHLQLHMAEHARYNQRFATWKQAQEEFIAQTERTTADQKAEVITMTADQAKLQNMKRNKQIELETLQYAKDNAVKRRDAVKATANDAATTLKQNQQLRDRLKEQMVSLPRLQDELRQQNKQQEELLAANKAHNELLGNFLEDLHKRQDERNKCTEQIKAASKEIKTLEKDLKKADKQLKSAEAARDSKAADKDALTQQVQEERNKLEQSKAQLAELRQKTAAALADTQKEESRAKAVEQQMQQLQSHVDKLKALQQKSEVETGKAQEQLKTAIDEELLRAVEQVEAEAKLMTTDLQEWKKHSKERMQLLQVQETALKRAVQVMKQDKCNEIEELDEQLRTQLREQYKSLPPSLLQCLTDACTSSASAADQLEEAKARHKELTKSSKAVKQKRTELEQLVKSASATLEKAKLAHNDHEAGAEAVTEWQALLNGNSEIALKRIAAGKWPPALEKVLGRDVLATLRASLNKHGEDGSSPERPDLENESKEAISEVQTSEASTQPALQPGSLSRFREDRSTPARQIRSRRRR